MAERQKRSAHWAELIGILVLVTFLVAVVLWGVGQMLPGLAPMAARGAQVATPGDLLFYLLAALAMVSAAGVAFSRNIIYAALSLLGALLAAGALYVYLNADFVAVTQLLIYVGGVLVLILFAVMLTSRIEHQKETNPSTGVVPGVALLGALLGVFGYLAVKAPWRYGAKPLGANATVDTIGDAFLGEYLLPFEVVSLLLVATLIGAVVIARKEIKE